MIFLISAFIALDLTLLFLNVHMTKKLEHDALIINVTGRQRMLSQNIAKDILITYNTNSPTLNENYTSLLNNTYTFQQTLIALQDGGKLVTPEGNNIVIPPIKDEGSLAIIDDVFTYCRQPTMRSSCLTSSLPMISNQFFSAMLIPTTR